MGLIRVRKLVFDAIGESLLADSSVGIYRVNRVNGGLHWSLLNETEWVRCDTAEAAIAACQSDFERRVLAEIEVVPLSFSDGHGWSECRNYYVNDNRFVYDGNGPALSGKALTREEAIDACNAHNRRLILGETEQ